MARTISFSIRSLKIGTFAFIIMPNDKNAEWAHYYLAVVHGIYLHPVLSTNKMISVFNCGGKINQ